MIEYKEIIDGIEYHVVDCEGKESSYDIYKKLYNIMDNNKYCLIINYAGIEYCFIKNGLDHRDNNLPSVKYENGSEKYYYNGDLHRIDGPAKINHDGTKCYYIHGKRISLNSDEEFARYVNLINFE